MMVGKKTIGMLVKGMVRGRERKKLGCLLASQTNSSSSNVNRNQFI